ERALNLLRDHRDKLDAVAVRLMEIETLGRDEFLELMGEPQPPSSAGDTPSAPTGSRKVDVEDGQTDTDMPPAPLGTAPSPA
ncbi:MAG: hypothetical protein M5R42_21385, partial [Rhodocyclaceae bacterium]|nr:hypothetical protein [Rhodocyclaceae bacterium]